MEARPDEAQDGGAAAKSPRRDRRLLAAAGGAAIVLVLAATRCGGAPEAPTVVLAQDLPVEDAATPAAEATAAATPEAVAVSTRVPVKKTVARRPAPARSVPLARATPRKKKLRADVVPEDFEVTGVSVSETGYRARIDGWVRLTRKGTLAQPRLSFDLKDGAGRLIRSGSFTPVDETGPIWLGYDALGLKRVPFSTTVDLRAVGGVLPAVPPRPYSANVRVAEVVDAKPASK